MSITLNVKGLDKLIKTAEKYPQIAEKFINKAINLSLVRVLGQEKQTAPFGVSGALRDNWKIEMNRFEGRLYSLSQYAMDVEKGTSPHYVSIEEITPWANKKGIPAWVVQRAIRLHGTKANPFFQKAVDAAESGVNLEFKNAMKSIKDALLNGTI